MLQPRGLGQRRDKGLPPAALLGQHPAALGGKTVIAAAALAGFLDPPARDPRAILELVEQGIERRDVERQQAARPPRDLARDVVAVELALLQRREDQELGAALLRRGFNDGISHIWESYISQPGIMRRQRGRMRKILIAILFIPAAA